MSCVGGEVHLARLQHGGPLDRHAETGEAEVDLLRVEHAHQAGAVLERRLAPLLGARGHPHVLPEVEPRGQAVQQVAFEAAHRRRVRAVPAGQDGERARLEAAHAQRAAVELVALARIEVDPVQQRIVRPGEQQVGLRDAAQTGREREVRPQLDRAGRRRRGGMVVVERAQRHDHVHDLAQPQLVKDAVDGGEGGGRLAERDQVAPGKVEPVGGELAEHGPQGVVAFRQQQRARPGRMAVQQLDRRRHTLQLHHQLALAVADEQPLEQVLLQPGPALGGATHRHQGGGERCPEVGVQHHTHDVGQVDQRLRREWRLGPTTAVEPQGGY
uniref:Uncharacterized protein n=1 Tax=Anopheles coluzzii TaxID=1518534 RepID=A0A8W7PSE2_ANOCL